METNLDKNTEPKIQGQKMTIKWLDKPKLNCFGWINEVGRGKIPETPILLWPNKNAGAYGRKMQVAGRSAIVDLETMLFTDWGPDDLHYLMYTNQYQTQVLSEHVKQRPELFEMRFTNASYDVDFDHHLGGYTDRDFERLVEHCYQMENKIKYKSGNSITPNVVYSTLKGARLIYTIEPMTDWEKFENCYQSLQNSINDWFEAIFGTSTSSWYMDMGAKDPWRLFRAPHVLRDGVATVSTIITLESELFDLEKHYRKGKGKGKKVFNYQGAWPNTTLTPKLIHIQKTMCIGQRQTKSWQAAQEIKQQYPQHLWPAMLAWLEHLAVDIHGFDPKEFKQATRGLR